VKSRQVAVYALLPTTGALPGGLVGQGEHPDDAVVRLVREQTGRSVRLAGLHAVSAHLSADGLVHTDRILYRVDGSADVPSWVLPEETPAEFVERRVQRFGAYGVVTDPADRVLLTRIASGYPGAGLWHLPGGGTDHGEQPEQGLVRELIEETSQHGRITGLLRTAHRYTPAAMGPEGVPMDWHVVRVLFRVEVDRPTAPVVTEQGGSTSAAAWFSRTELSDLPLTEVAREAVTTARLP
jgi:8-oxo-dGTP diphosphatase